MNEFDDIRPYHDDEINSAVKSVVSDPEFLDLIGRFRFPRFYSVFSWLLRPLLGMFLYYQARKITDVQSFQALVKKYLIRMIDTTMDSFSVSGLDKLDLSQPCLFISNHRDIALDPALVNYALFTEGSDTVRIAIGDNLLTKPFASDLMRINKSFIVQRSVGGPRELLKSLKKLSRYIWHSLATDKEHVWIAQREGRAKDGLDRTEPAIIKMLTIAKPRDVEFGDYVESLHIVPVSVSYEFDPCDGMKAAELRQRAEQGNYEKDEHEDLLSIGLGISGYKGRVHLHFGDVLRRSDLFSLRDADSVASAIDHSIVNNYRLQTSNLVAFELLHGETHLSKLDAAANDGQNSAEREKFLARMAELPDQDMMQALNMYANPVQSRLDAE